MVNFSRPPINEVALSQSFVSRLDLLVPHFGEFWATIKDKFPKTQHATPVVSPGDMPLQDPFGSWLPRVWFVSEDDTRLVQLQQDRLIVNWRQTERGEEYVRFPAVKAEFDSAWGNLDRYVAERLGTPLQPTRLELSYVNIIPAGKEESITDVCGRVLRDYTWAAGPRFLPKPGKLQSFFEVPLRDSAGSLSVRISGAQRLNDGLLVLRFELVASGSLPEGMSRDKWIEIAHETIVLGFKDLTSLEAQSTEWGVL